MLCECPDWVQVHELISMASFLTANYINAHKYGVNCTLLYKVVIDRWKSVLTNVQPRLVSFGPVMTGQSCPLNNSPTADFNG